MKSKKRSVLAVLLVAAMIFSVTALVSSCNQSEAPKDITVFVKIIGSNDYEHWNNNLVMPQVIPSELTVLMVTARMCKDVLSIPFDYDKELDAVKRIGPDISELFLKDYEVEEEPAETEEGEEPGEEPGEAEEKAETTEAPVKDYYDDWTCTINGVEATISDKVKEGDKIEWIWKQVKKEFVDKSRN